MKVGRKLVKDMKVAELKEELESRLDGSEIPDKWPRKAELIKLLQRTVRRDARKKKKAKKAKKAKKSSQPAAAMETNEEQEQEQEEPNPSQVDDTMDMDAAETQDIDEEPSAEQDGEGSVIAGRVEADPYGDAYGGGGREPRRQCDTLGNRRIPRDGAATSSDEEDGDAMEVVQDRSTARRSRA